MDYIAEDLWCLLRDTFAGTLFNQGVIGKQGPIIINTRIVEHDIFNEDETEPEIIITIGKHGKIINKKRIDKAYEKIVKKGSRYFNSGRSYYFEGSSKKGDTIEFYWGS